MKVVCLFDESQRPSDIGESRTYLSLMSTQSPCSHLSTRHDVRGGGRDEDIKSARRWHNAQGKDKRDRPKSTKESPGINEEKKDYSHPPRYRSR